MLTCITKKFTLETITIGDSLWMCAHWLVWLVRFREFNLHRKRALVFVVNASWPARIVFDHILFTAFSVTVSRHKIRKWNNTSWKRDCAIYANQSSNRQSSSDFNAEQRPAARRENRTSGITVRWCPLTLLAWCSLLDSRLTLLHPAVVAAPSVAGVGSAGCVVKRQHDVRGA